MPNLVNVARINGKKLLFLRKLEPKLYQWFDQDDKTDVQAETQEEAIRLAYRKWQDRGFQMLPCGYVFTLPERDEHGNNASFSQMGKSLESMTGVYYDEDLGHSCIVNQIPNETRKIYNSLKQTSSI